MTKLGANLWSEKSLSENIGTNNKLSEGKFERSTIEQVDNKAN